MKNHRRWDTFERKMASSQTTNNNSNVTEEAMAALLQAQAQSMQIENKMRKTQLQRNIEHQTRVDRECDEAKQARAPSRKREREYVDACNVVKHDDRMRKLREKQTNDNNVRDCTIERKSRNMLIELEDQVKAAERDVEWELNRQRQEAADVDFENTEDALRLQRRLALIKARFEFALETLRQQEKQHRNDVDLENQQRSVVNTRKLEILRTEVERANVRLELCQKFGTAIPQRLFE